MSHDPDTSTPSNPYDDLYGGGDAAHWAFGTGFEDPLAGLGADEATALPEGVAPRDLATYSLMLADALVMSHRLSQWCSNAPDLEDDVALANIALDLLGQARLLLTRASAADPAVVPVLPEEDEIYAYAIGILAGTVVQFLLPLPWLRGRGGR